MLTIARRWLGKLAEEPLHHYPMDRFSLKSPILYRPEHRVVHVGGGPLRNHPLEWNLNLFRGSNIDVVGDAERLPLADGSVDVIISNAVLEHVRDLNAVVGEMRRVLKPGGYLYVEIPFVQNYHTHDGRGVRFEDYRRFTKVGLAEALNFCRPIDVGVCVGPTSSALQTLYAWAGGFSTSDLYQRWLRRLYCFGGNLIVGLDAVMSDEAIQRSTIPCGVYFFGRKPDQRTACLDSLPWPNSIFPRDIDATITARPSGADTLNVSVVNSSRTTWIKESALPWGSVNVGLQLERGGVLDRDFRRIPLPRDIPPGDRFSFEVDWREVPCGAALKIDLVIEGLCWFADRGHRPLAVSGRSRPTSPREALAPAAIRAAKARVLERNLR